VATKSLTLSQREEVRMFDDENQPAEDQPSEAPAEEAPSEAPAEEAPSEAPAEEAPADDSSSEGETPSE
tara:strand:- start:320 stop:526 length:207 start_codon:yes stop_codon:yes gene_type:complete